MIINEADITKEKTDEGEIWTTPWRTSRVEAYVDLVDCSQFLHDYLATFDPWPQYETTLEDDDENSRHRAYCTLTITPENKPSASSDSAST